MAEVEPFKPAWWLRNPHLQTFWPYLVRFKPKLGYQRERIELPDDDFIDLDWLKHPTQKSPKAIVLLLHGLQGCSRSHYIRGFAASLNSSGYQVAAINLRGRSGEMNRQAVFYHAGYSYDLDFVIRRIADKHPDLRINIVAVSLGGNILLNWLASTEDATQLINAAAVISVPLLLASCAKKMEHGLSRIYQHYLISSLKKATREKLKRIHLPNILPHWEQSRTFFEFDDAVTSRLHGFKNVDDYYEQASTKNKLSKISIPLLLIQAKDDPFMSTEVIPNSTELNSNTTLEVYEHGGHVGFVSANRLKPYYWLDNRITTFLEHTN